MKLLKDDIDLENTLNECITIKSPAQLRELFAMICVWSEPTDPRKLFEKFKNHLIEDYLYQNIEEERAINICLNDFEKYFIMRQKKNSDFNLPEPTFFIDNDERIELNQEKRLAEHFYQLLNDEQRYAVDTILKSIDSNDNKDILIFIDGPGNKFIF